MNTRPEALRLSDCIDPPQIFVSPEMRKAAAAELRRLHALNQELEQENTKLWGWYHDAEQHLAVLQGRAKTTGEQS